MIIAEPSEKPGCEVIERSKYRETRSSGKAPSEARDRGTRFRCEAMPCLQFKGAIPQPRNLKASQNHNPAVPHSQSAEPPRADQEVTNDEDSLTPRLRRQSRGGNGSSSPIYPFDQNKWSRQGFESHFYFFFWLSEVSSSVRVCTAEDFLRVRY